MNQTTFTLLDKRQLTSDVFELRFAGDTSAITNPGQFVNLELEGLYLRRPISICDWSDGQITLICRAVGQGTRALCNAPLGAQFQTLVGLGNGYDKLKATQNPVLIGGGVGVPPLYALAKQLCADGITPTVALGFASKDDCFYEEEFKNLGCRVLISTVDGSHGKKGFVTTLLQEDAPQCDYVFCCGPEPMLKAVYQLPQLVGGQFSFEERMGCGFGACMGCTCKTKYGCLRICKDGPVLKKEDIVW